MRKKMPIQIVIAAIIFLSNYSIVSGNEALDHVYFDGIWEGKLLWINPSEHQHSAIIGADWLSDHEGMVIKLSINNEVTKIFLRNKDRWTEIKPQDFILNKHKTNAVIYAIESSEDINDKTGKGGWVETWNFTLTRKDPNHMYAYFVKVVNNYLKPPNYKNDNNNIIGRYFRSAFGELTRIE